MSASIDLNARRKLLKMPVDMLVKRSAVPRPTVFRILRGMTESVRFDSVEKVARVLGISFGQLPIEIEELRRQEAVRKAKLVSRLMQGTMGLEAQAVDPSVLDDVEAKTVAQLLAGKGRKLWGD